MKILVVDDNESIRELVECFLETAGHTAVLACDAQEATELLNSGEKFDCIISDKDMPGMSGLDLLRRVRATAQTANVRFFLMSGMATVSLYDDTPLEEACAKLGAGFLFKPFYEGELNAKLSQLGAV